MTSCSLHETQCWRRFMLNSRFDQYLEQTCFDISRGRSEAQILPGVLQILQYTFVCHRASNTKQSQPAAHPLVVTVLVVLLPFQLLLALLPWLCAHLSPSLLLPLPLLLEPTNAGAQMYGRRQQYSNLGLRHLRLLFNSFCPSGNSLTSPQSSDTCPSVQALFSLHKITR